MSSVSYGGKRLIPAPNISVRKEFRKSADGTNIGSVFLITVTGRVVAYKGSPQSDGTFWTNTGYPADESIDADARLGALLRKKEAIRQLFADEGKSFEVQSADGTSPMKCNPRVISLEFPTGQWFDYFDYTIELEADVVYGAAFLGADGEDGFTEYLSDVQESWTIEPNDEPEFIGQDTLSFRTNQTYRLTHSISAIGKRFYDSDGNLEKPAWQQARDYVLPRLGLDADRITSSGVLNLPDYYAGFNHARAESIDETGGSYSVTETWVISSGSAIEDVTVTTRKAQESDLVNVTIEGRITGMEIRDSDFQITQSRYQSAENKFTSVSGLVYIRAKELSGYNLNINPVSYSISRSHNQGAIQYSYEFNDRASNIVASSKFEDINISDNLQSELFAEIPILERLAGPLLQDLHTKSAPRRSLSVRLTVPKRSPTSSVASLQAAFVNPRLSPSTSGDIFKIIEAAKPVGYNSVFQTEPQEFWDPWTGNYSLNMNWVYGN